MVHEMICTVCVVVINRYLLIRWNFQDQTKGQRELETGRVKGVVTLMREAMVASFGDFGLASVQSSLSGEAEVVCVGGWCPWLRGLRSLEFKPYSGNFPSGFLSAFHQSTQL